MERSGLPGQPLDPGQRSSLDADRPLAGQLLDTLLPASVHYAAVEGETDPDLQTS